jgi:phosphoribosylamine--glycine ligase
MAAEGAPYVGVLYVGLMADRHGAKLVEYNARFGDPECQVLMLRLESDLVPLPAGRRQGHAGPAAATPVWRDEAAICVVLATEGYPDGRDRRRDPRPGAGDFGARAVVFHAGASPRRRREAAGVRRGGRSTSAPPARPARGPRRAYAAVAAIDWPGGFHRTDIGWRALGR